MNTKISSAILLLAASFARAQSAPQFTISTIAGTGVAGYSGDAGPAAAAEMNNPRGVAVDSAGNIYIADQSNNRIRKVSAGQITTVAGTGAAGFNGDGGQATSAELNQPIRVSVDAQGNLYIADSSNVRVRKVTPAGIITTVAGNGSMTVSGDGGQAVNAGLGGVGDAEPDAQGNLYIIGANLIRKVAPTGIITTIAGNGGDGYSGDGGSPLNASFNNANCLTLGPTGDIFISDEFNNVVRKINNGVITTIAGTGAAGFSGDGGLATKAQLNNVACLALDTAGNLYIGDSGNNRIRVLLTNGTIATAAGSGSASYSGDGGQAVNAALNSPKAPAAYNGVVYFADTNNNRIRLLLQHPQLSVGGVVSASAFGEFTSVSPGSWIEIYGASLAVDARGWTQSDFNGNNAPTFLDGTSVTFAGQQAFISYISPGQVNALVPSNVPTGTQQLIVTNPAGASSAVSVTVNAVEPGLLAPPSFNIGGVQYVTALVYPDGAFALPTGAMSGARPAVPGDVLTLYGVGFGPVTPSIPAGELVQESNSLALNFQVSIGGQPATVLYAGLAPGFTGLYQVNIEVPSVTAGNQPFTFNLGGTAGTQTLYLAVGQ